MLEIGFYSRDSNFHEIVEDLLSHHDDNQLNEELGDATSGVTSVGADAQESGPDFIISRVSEKLSLFNSTNYYEPRFSSSRILRLL